MTAVASVQRRAPGRRRARAKPRRAARPNGERAAGVAVDLGCLPRLLGFGLRRAYMCAWRQYVEAIGETSVRPGLFSLLVLVGANPGIAQIELGRHLGTDKASIVALLDRLEKSALVLRRRSLRDRRRQGIFLTSQGAEQLAALVSQVRTLERRMASRYTRAEFDQLLGLLRRLYA